MRATKENPFFFEKTGNPLFFFFLGGKNFFLKNPFFLGGGKPQNLFEKKTPSKKPRGLFFFPPRLGKTGVPPPPVGGERNPVFLSFPPLKPGFLGKKISKISKSFWGGPQKETPGAPFLGPTGPGGLKAPHFQGPPGQGARGEQEKTRAGPGPKPAKAPLPNERPRSGREETQAPGREKPMDSQFALCCSGNPQGSNDG